MLSVLLLAHLDLLAMNVITRGIDCYVYRSTLAVGLLTRCCQPITLPSDRTVLLFRPCRTPYQHRSAAQNHTQPLYCMCAYSDRPSVTQAWLKMCESLRCGF